MSVVTPITPAATSRCLESTRVVSVASPTSCTATVTDSTPMSATAPSGPVSFSQDTDSTAFASCGLGGASTNSLTGAVSTSCTVTYTPATVGAHLITASYGGDTTHLGSAGTTTVTALKHYTTTTVNHSPASEPEGNPTSCTPTVTDSTPMSATAPSGPVSFSQDTDSTPFASFFF